MTKQLVLFNEENYFLTLCCEEEVIDYYSIVNINLVYKEKVYNIFSDNILYLYNLCKSDIKELDPGINESDMGISLNRYYYDLTDECMEEDYFHVDSKYATAIYKLDGVIYIKVVELYPDMEREDISAFNRYISGYTDVFVQVVEYEQIEEIRKVVIELYEQSVSYGFL